MRVDVGASLAPDLKRVGKPRQEWMSIAALRHG
jgi:hypothetical protein